MWGEKYGEIWRDHDSSEAIGSRFRCLKPSARWKSLTQHASMKAFFYHSSIHLYIVYFKHSLSNSFIHTFINSAQSFYLVSIHSLSLFNKDGTAVVRNAFVGLLGVSVGQSRTRWQTHSESEATATLRHVGEHLVSSAVKTLWLDQSGSPGAWLRFRLVPAQAFFAERRTSCTFLARKVPLSAFSSMSENLSVFFFPANGSEKM